jgi:acetyltransferase-like isoleucine patch superfamily enzyme
MFGIKQLAKKFVVGQFLKGNRIECSSMPVFIGKWPRFDIRGTFKLGRECRFRHLAIPIYVSVIASDAVLEIGDECLLNDGVNICSAKKISIGDHCLIGDRTIIYDTNFHHIQPGQAITTAEIIIQKNVWIGARSIILPGAGIGAHSVIGAGSVVTTSIPPKVVAAGCPAKVIREFKCDDDWIRN